MHSSSVTYWITHVCGQGRVTSSHDNNVFSFSASECLHNSILECVKLYSKEIIKSKQFTQGI